MTAYLLTDYSFSLYIYIYTALTGSCKLLYLVTLKHIHEDWKYLESDAMPTGSEEIF